MDPSEVADAVARAAAGDRDAWELLVDSFSSLVWAVAVSHRLSQADAAEVVQTTWLRLLENVDRIRDPARLGGWLATTARRESLHLLRRNGRETTTDDASAFDNLDEASPEDLALVHDRDRRLWRAFAALPERCRTLLHLVVLVKPPYAEIATALDIPVGSIGPTRARCLARLRELLAAAGAAEARGR